MINLEIINERLREMEKNITLLKELKSVSLNKFLNDPKMFKLAEHCLQISIQRLLDICHHIIVDNNWPRPKNNQEAIEIISRYKIIPEQLANRILPMAGLRNILIHEYLKIDLKRIYEHLQDTKDFRKFQKHILKYIKHT